MVHGLATTCEANPKRICNERKKTSSHIKQTNQLTACHHLKIHIQLLAVEAIKTMKIISASFCVLFAASGSAFAPSNLRSFSTRLCVERGNSSDAIQEAIEASRKFGPTSQQARVAWDIVEEINASDNR